MRELNGRLSGDQGWAVTRAATLAVEAAGVRIRCEDGQTLEAPWSDVRLKASLNQEAVVILDVRGPDGHHCAFETLGAPLLEALRERAPGGPLRGDIDAVNSQLRGIQKRGSRQVAAVLLALASVIGLFAWSLWALPAYAIRHIPLSWEEALGQSTLAQLRGQGRELTSGPAHDAVHAVWNRISPSLPPSPYTFRITVIDAPVVNAFAMPGGYVVVYTGLLEALDSPQALAGILGHEAAHVVRKHSLQSMLSNMQWRLGLSLFWSLFGGSSDATLNQLQEQAVGLLTLAHSRQHESEADEDGLRTLQGAGIDAAPFRTFFLALAEKEGDRLAILSTHPPSQARAAALETFEKTLPPTQVRPIEIDWKALQRNLRTQSNKTDAAEP